ncbi:unnamed protein product, partial [Staurois parvus]
PERQTPNQAPGRPPGRCRTPQVQSNTRETDPQPGTWETTRKVQDTTGSEQHQRDRPPTRHLGDHQEGAGHHRYRARPERQTPNQDTCETTRKVRDSTGTEQDQGDRPP